MNINPSPQTGVLSPYGMVPGALEAITPPNPYADLSGVVPNLGAMNTAASGDVLSQLSGDVSPGTLAALRNAAATWGVGSGTGMGINGLGGLATNKLFGNVAGFAENQANRGLENYGRIIPTISGTQTLSPALNLQTQQFNTEISAKNALNRAAPNPAMAQSYAQQLFSNYMNSMRSPSGGGGGARMVSNPEYVAPSSSWEQATGPAGGVEYAGSYMAPDYAQGSDYGQNWLDFTAANAGGDQGAQYGEDWNNFNAGYENVDYGDEF
jgi:hypothetical protein